MKRAAPPPTQGSPERELRPLRRVAVYCGSSNAVAEVYKEAARATARALVAREIEVVFGGGSVGLMGVLADAALAAGGRVIGVIPEKLQQLELGHRGVQTLHVVDGMHTRKKQMSDLADGFIALPGGWGTMEELFEVLTWTQLNYFVKPVGLLNVGGFYDPLLAWADHAAAEGFIRPLHRGLLRAATDPEVLLDDLATCEIPTLDRWIERR